MSGNAMYKLTYGLFVLSAKEDGFDNACIINTAVQVTTTPNRITIAVNKDNKTHDMIKNTGVFNVSVLTQSAPFSIFKRFGFASGRDVNKFEDFSATKRAENGIYYITEHTNAYISGKVVDEVDMGTHTIFIADVTSSEVLSDETSVTYEYYQSNIKPKPEKPAGGTVKWVCRVCGYVYEGEELPPEFKCPWCNHGPEDFEKVVG